MSISRKGIALLVVLWVWQSSTVTAFSFAVMTRAETQGTLAFRGGDPAEVSGRGGQSSGASWKSSTVPEPGPVGRSGGRAAWKADGTPHRIEMAGGRCSVRIIDESGKISLNALTDSSGIILKNLLLRHGATPEQPTGSSIRSWDWKDPDDLHRLSGAESEYYQSLPKPYPPAERRLRDPGGTDPRERHYAGHSVRDERADGIIRHLTAQG